MKYEKTWLAIIVAFIAAIPGLIVGALVAHVYRSLMRVFEGGLLDWITSGWADKIFNSIFPNLVHGMIGGAIAIWLASKILKRANYEIVAYSVSTIICMLALFSIVLGGLKDGLGIATIEIISNSAGVVAGLFIGSQGARERQFVVERIADEKQT